jgi:hypothetical protein
MQPTTTTLRFADLGSSPRPGMQRPINPWNSLEAHQAGTTSRLAPLSRDSDRGELSVGLHASELKVLVSVLSAIVYVSYRRLRRPR